VEGPAGLIRAVTAAQARLVARWMGLGFIHGVMNTDNMAVSGETIDYGPCAFLDGYDPAKVFSSIDAQGRYAYQMQPQVALWNLAQFASCLLPLMGEEKAALAEAQAGIDTFREIYPAEWLRVFGAKIGIAAPGPEDLRLVEALLERMAADRADFTRAFRGLTDGSAADEFADRDAFAAWERDWRARIAREADPEAVMAGANPAFIPRNHRIEEAITAAVAGDLGPFRRLLAVLARPFEDQPEAADLARAPVEGEEVRRTFCGT
jgi:uncharacterized protein YdiU (UPF0061 family)